MREPPEGRFGLYLGNGTWTGIVGALQQDVADFSTEIGLLPPRLQAMEPSFIYARDRIVIASPKPGPLPQHLAISRPFAGACLMSPFLFSFFFSFFHIIGGFILPLCLKSWLEHHDVLWTEFFSYLRCNVIIYSLAPRNLRDLCLDALRD